VAMAGTRFAEHLTRSLFTKLATRRRARAFHPRGQVCTGELETLSAGDLPLPRGTSAVTARLSKGAGTPAGFPDALGLALRITGEDGDAWDLALTTSGPGVLGRMLPWPERAWTSGRYSSLAPYRVANRLVWVGATASDRPPWDDASLAALARLTGDAPLRLTLYTCAATGPARPAALVTLRSSGEDDAELEIDPMTRHPAGARLYPAWLTRVRELAYRGSRDGRPRRARPSFPVAEDRPRA
jgi:hypothetical protein